MKQEERLERWQRVNNLALLEVRCKIGSMKQSLMESYSIGDAFFIVQSFRALEKVRAETTEENIQCIHVCIAHSLITCTIK